MTYEQYISSNDWKQKRQQRIDFDGGRCAICHGTDNLSVHHLHYDSLGNEDIQHDLITACSRCHRHLDTIERYNRYQKRQRVVANVSIDIHERRGVEYGMENNNLQVNVSVSTPDAQRSDGRSNEQIRQSFEADYVKARADRR